VSTGLVNMENQAQVSKDNKYLPAFLNISEILISGREITTTLQLVLNYLIDKLEVTSVGIVWVYDSSTESLIAKSTSGFDFNILKGFRLKAKDTTVSRVFQIGRNELYTADKTIVGSKSDKTAETEKIFGVQIPGLNLLSSAACLPLIRDKSKYGVLTLLNLGGRSRINRNSMYFFQSIANLIAIAIENLESKRDSKIIERLESDDHRKAELISILAHEMRTPLTSIKGYSTALLMEEATFNHKTQREFLEIIDRECDVLQGLISDFLESSTIDGGALKINLQPIRLPRLVTEVTNDIARRFPKHSLLVDFQDEFPIVDADPERIVQVIRQLLDNAAKYSPKGGLIYLQGRIQRDEALISVADEGVGISPEDLNQLFEKFFRAKLGPATQVVGTGLGLPICRNIVEAHGGRIWAESRLGQGSTVYFTIPLKRFSRDLAD